MKSETMVRLVKWTALLACGLAVVVFDTGCRSTSGPQKRRSGLMDDRGMIPPAYSEPGTQRAAPRPVEPVIGLAPLAPEEFVDEPLSDLALPPPTSGTIVELPPPLESETLTYEVKRGDSLWKIARAYGITHQELAAFNNMNETDNLLVGRVLRIPPGGKFVPTEERAQVSPARPAAAASSDTPRPASPSGGRALNEQGHYTVRSGDSLWLVARDFGVKVDDLRRANNLSGDVIHVGDQLVVPGAAARPADAPRPTPSETVVETAPPSETPPEVDEPAVDEPPVALPNMLDYTVTDGDSLQNIADMFSIDVEMIRRANPGIRTDADLRPNTTIRVPLN